MTVMIERVRWPTVLLGVWLAACSSSPPDTPAPAAAVTGLAGTAWRLVEFRGGDDTRLTPDDRDKYTVEFRADGSLVIRLDCNRGRGSWKSSGPRLELGPLALTRMACPPGSLHDRMVKHWPYIRSYVVKDGHLFLALMADGGIYEFEPSSSKSPAGQKQDATVENTYWKLTALAGKPARLADNIEEPHFVLHPADTQVGGSTGCNQFSGSYQLSGDSLRFGQLISTLRACVDPELNRQERAFLDALGATRNWRVIGDSLELSGEAGPVAMFGAQYLR
jgi:heat shock protein HslJ